MIIFAATAPAVPERAMRCGSKFLLNAAMRGSGNRVSAERIVYL